MRLAAYKKLIDSANELPEKLDGNDYFKHLDINPKALIITRVMEKARADIKGLFNSEFSELVNYVYKEIK